MTKKRMLNEDELKISKMGVYVLNEELSYHKYVRDHANLMLNQGLWANYVKARNDYKEKLKDSNQLIDLIDKKLVILQDQITNGVEPKENKK